MALSTKKALAESLRRLLSKRTLDKITVKDIVEDCGVNRQTFYYHFHDVYDLLEWIFEDNITSMMEEGENDKDWTRGVDTIIHKMLEDRKLILNAYHSVSHEVVSGFIRRWLKPFVRYMVDQKAVNLEVAEEDKEFVAEMFTLATTGFFTEWVENGLLEERLHNLEKIKLALDGSAESILLRLDQNKA